MLTVCLLLFRMSFHILTPGLTWASSAVSIYLFIVYLTVCLFNNLTHVMIVRNLIGSRSRSFNVTFEFTLLIPNVSCQVFRELSH